MSLLSIWVWDIEQFIRELNYSPLLFLHLFFSATKTLRIIPWRSYWEIKLSRLWRDKISTSQGRIKRSLLEYSLRIAPFSLRGHRSMRIRSSRSARGATLVSSTFTSYCRGLSIVIPEWHAVTRGLSDFSTAVASATPGSVTTSDTHLCVKTIFLCHAYNF